LVARIRCLKCGSIRPVWLGNYTLGTSPIIDKLLKEHFENPEKAKCGRIVDFETKAKCNGNLIVEPGELTIQDDWTGADKIAYEHFLGRKDKGDDTAYG